MAVVPPGGNSWLADALHFTHFGENRAWVVSVIGIGWTGTWLPGLVRFATAPHEQTGWRPADYIALASIVLSALLTLSAPFINVYINRRWGAERKRPRRRRRAPD